MKYLVFQKSTQLASSVLGTAYVGYNPLAELKKCSSSEFELYTIEEEAPSGTFFVRISGTIAYFTNGKHYGLEKVDIENSFLTIFEPDDNFNTLNTGYCIDLTPDVFKDNVKDTSFLILSTEKGPKVWTKAIFENEVLDFGVITCGSKLMGESPCESETL